ncbi:MAG: lamin tail domain-containing protein [Sedimentisphaerales bacterium]|nr:lamin tail domain-containing protein [Sedimentisphaerales bacterium]
MKTQLSALILVLFMASLVSADCPVGDLNRDCLVNFYDFASLAVNWLEVEPNLPFGLVVINEVMAHSHAGEPDWIELYNTSGSMVDISNWYLSDSDSPLTKYKIPNGTTIPTNGYIVFYQYQHFGVDHGNNVPFALSENGESVYLSFPDITSNPKHVCDDIKFDASETGVSFGRYITSTGDVKFTAMDSNTPGQPNTYPKIGPIVINEIMYDPYEGSDAEYIELHNIEDYPVPLRVYDPCTEGYVPWIFTQGPNFSFDSPNDVNIPANGYLIVARNTSEFTSTYGSMPPGVQVLGPFANSTKLSNDGENVEISVPGDLDPCEPEVRYYIRIDNVRYSDGSHHQDFPGLDPWPKGPDNDGEALYRIDPALYGDDVNNWQAGEATPGY